MAKRDSCIRSGRVQKNRRKGPASRSARKPANNNTLRKLARMGLCGLGENRVNQVMESLVLQHPEELQEKWNAGRKSSSKAASKRGNYQPRQLKRPDLVTNMRKGPLLTLLQTLYGEEHMQAIQNKHSSRNEAEGLMAKILTGHWDSLCTETEVDSYFVRVNNQSLSLSNLFHKRNGLRPWPPALDRSRDSDRRNMKEEPSAWNFSNEGDVQCPAVEASHVESKFCGTPFGIAREHEQGCAPRISFIAAEVKAEVKAEPEKQDSFNDMHDGKFECYEPFACFGNVEQQVKDEQWDSFEQPCFSVDDNALSSIRLGQLSSQCNDGEPHGALNLQLMQQLFSSYLQGNLPELMPSFHPLPVDHIDSIPIKDEPLIDETLLNHCDECDAYVPFAGGFESFDLSQLTGISQSPAPDLDEDDNWKMPSQ